MLRFIGRAIETWAETANCGLWEVMYRCSPWGFHHNVMICLARKARPKYLIYAGVYYRLVRRCVSCVYVCFDWLISMHQIDWGTVPTSTTLYYYGTSTW